MSVVIINFYLMANYLNLQLYFLELNQKVHKWNYLISYVYFWDQRVHFLQVDQVKECILVVLKICSIKYNVLKKLLS